MTDQTPNSSPWSQAFSQLIDRTECAPRRQHFNPRPPGILQTGGAAQAVNAFLEQNPGRYFTCAQIILGTGRTDKSVDWALLMLRSVRRVEMRRDPRNARYWQYAFKPASDDAGGQS